MTEITKKDYETVEKTRKVTVCDCCGMESDNTIQLVSNPKINVVEDRELVRTYEDKTQAQREIHKWESAKMGPPPTNNMVYGMARTYSVDNVDSDTVLHMCKTCFKSTFNIDLPDEAEIEFENGKITPKIERKTVSGTSFIAGALATALLLTLIVVIA